MRAAVMALTEATALRSMQGIWTRPPDRVAGQPQVVLDPDLGGVLDLLGGTPPRSSANPPAAIEHAEPTSPWHPTSAPEIDAFLLNSSPIAPAVSRKRTTASSSNSADGARRVVQDRGHDAGRAVGGGGDHPAAGGVLLVDGQGVEGDAVHRLRGVHLLVEVTPELGRAAAHAQAPGQDPARGRPALDALAHHRPEVQQAGPGLLLGAPDGLVREHHVADPQAVVPGAGDELVAGVEGVGHGRRVLAEHGLARLVLVEDEATADRVVLATVDAARPRRRGRGRPCRCCGRTAGPGGGARRRRRPRTPRCACRRGRSARRTARPRRSVRPPPGRRGGAARRTGRGRRRGRCRGRARWRPGSRTARSAPTRHARGGRCRAAARRRGTRRASAPRCASWTGRSRP